MEFREYVDKKFGSMANFSKLATGSFQTYKGVISNTAELFKKARKTKYDLSKVYVDAFDILAIECRMREIIKKRNDGYDDLFDSAVVKKWSKYKVADWLRENKISHSYYSSLLSGRFSRKNKAYENLLKKLGL